MQTRHFVVSAAAALSVLVPLTLSAPALAQNATAPNAPAPSAQQPERIPSLFVLNAAGATLKDKVLTLTGVTPNSIIFADRPYIAAGHIPTRTLIEGWGTGDDSFAKSPPNAAVSVAADAGKSVKDAVVTLKNPRLDGQNLIFDVDVLEGDISGADGAATVFVDVIGMPATPRSFAGAARRAGRRAYWYGAPPPRAYLPPPPPPVVAAHPYYHPYAHPYYHPYAHPYARPYVRPYVHPYYHPYRRPYRRLY